MNRSSRPLIPLLRFVLHGVTLLAALSLPAFGANDEPSSDGLPAVDFLRDVRPLLNTHCIRCHGPDQRAGGLRLDERLYVEQGGDSGGEILGGTLETNELYRRVASTNLADRMPKSAPPLSAGEIDILRRWVDAGTPWVDPTGESTSLDPPPEPLLFRLYGLYEQYTANLRYLRTFLFVLISLQIGWLVVERLKRTARSRTAEGQPPGRWPAASLSLRLSHFLTACTLLTAAFAIVTLADLYRKRVAEKEQLAQQVEQLKQQLGVNASAASYYGNPPVPHRPQHPRRLQGTYYRGNCERNENLYNNGNYRTATFKIALTDSAGAPLDFRSSLPEDGLWIEFEMIRAPGTAETLFSDGIIDSIFLSEKIYNQEAAKPVDDTPARLETVKPNWHWRTRVPLPPPHDGRISGLIYVYKGSASGEIIRGEPHYGIKYDLVVQDGQIAPASDLWMNSVYWNSQIVPPQPDKVPLDEWFDWRPLPEIEGENTTDPKLLGIEEHAKP